MVRTSVLRLSKIFSLEMAHAITNYTGKCSNIHGHSYRLEITIQGSISQENKNGMIIDFKNFKDIIKQHLINPYDHALLLEDTPELREWCSKIENFTQNIKFLPFTPSTENILLYFVNIIEDKLPQHVSLFSIRLFETEESYAEWFRDDQKGF